MARGRMINQRLCRSQKYANLKSDLARVLYVLMYTQTDCEGRIYADPNELKIDCCPYIKKYTVRKIAAAVIELADSGLISLYEVNDEPYVEFTDFDENQGGLRKDREAPSRFPAKIRSNSGVTPLKYKVLTLTLSNEVKKKELMSYDVDSRIWQNINDKDKKQWKETYPACDIHRELLMMGDWLISNPTKVKSNYKRFITNWLSRVQDRGGTKTAALAATGRKGRVGAGDRWLEKKEKGEM